MVVKSGLTLWSTLMEKRESRTVTVAVTSHTAAFKSNSSFHFNTMYEGLLEVSVKLKEGVLNHSNHSAVTFKENMHPNPGSVMGVAQQNFLGREGVAADLRIDGEKVGGGHRGRKLSKTIRDRGNLFKSSTSRIPLPDSVNNLVEFITSQIEKDKKRPENRWVLRMPLDNEVRFI
ncbi:hypothetical protein E1A91_D06G113700v1 [Gossypium mustelinum]|uniref:Uncharacterized protein n=1 Tax=Gossypium mustelinum TaxID=34275 RepID=A0A5D2UI52_GOSMU|nr:hypothetical protein E1A91_D06G113700v1 [Gossypium mustelinum]